MNEDAEEAEKISRLEEELGHRFRDRVLLEMALRHSSHAHELLLGESGSDTSVESNERLEFLGDAVLALVVAEALYAVKPDWREGDLTRALHSIVEGRSLADLARSIGVGEVLQLGRTEESSGGREKPSILEDAMEALIGAIYLDGGLDPVERFVRRFFGKVLAADAIRVERHPKTELQETLMAVEGEFPTYQLLRDSEVDGDEQRFTIVVTSKGKRLAEGVGRTKRAAEELAATRALETRIESSESEY
ncbi:MAG: ribonuclease III [bacterium]|nr:ribonuclease III [Deltaproteobacteria bacterium]MCP4908392.1 ribonuclease III [bacterium]